MKTKIFLALVFCLISLPISFTLNRLNEGILNQSQNFYQEKFYEYSFSQNQFRKNVFKHLFQNSFSTKATTAATSTINYHLTLKSSYSTKYSVAPVFNSTLKKYIRLEGYSYRFWKSSNILPRQLSMNEHSSLMDLIKIVSEFLSENNIEFMMCDEALLGSFRHFDLIPWHNRMEMLVWADDYKNMIKIFQKKIDFLKLEWTLYMDYEKSAKSLKTFLSDFEYTSDMYWKFPYVNFMFYEKNSTHLWKQNQINQIINISYVYPLIFRPLGKYWLPSPRDPEIFLNSFGYLNVERDCVRGDWDSRTESSQEVIKLDCSLLVHEYPFVSRNCSNSSCVESLTLFNQTIRQIVYN